METIREVASNSEIESIENMIISQKNVTNCLMALRKADKILEEAMHAVTVEIFRAEEGEKVSVLPEVFVTQHDGEWFLVTLDIEGDDGHEIKKIGGVF